MPRLPLIGGAYMARGPIANAQSCINLFAENNTQDAAFPVTHYPASGLSVYADYTGIFNGYVRGLYWSSRGQFFAAVGDTVIQVTGPGPAGYTTIVNIGNSGYPVSMMDNGNILCIVDGTANQDTQGGTVAGGNGWFVDLATLAVQKITDPAFDGASKVDYIDTFFVFNWPGTPTFYSTLSNITLTTSPQWDSAYWAEKTGYNDHLMTLIALHDNLWLFGAQTTEIWFNAGTPGLPFQRMPNAVLHYGVVGQWAAIISGESVYWLSQDRNGRLIFMQGQGFQSQRVSNYAVENEWANYTFVSDTQLMAYQQAGHEYIHLYFPIANRSWTFDTAGHWHRRTFGPNDDAWLPYTICPWGTLYDQGPGQQNLIIAGDRTGPRLLAIDRYTYTDVGLPIKRVRAWPHVVEDQRRMAHTQFVAALQSGSIIPDQVTLRWSDDYGNNFGSPVSHTTNQRINGQYQWRRLGYTRDRVYELSWTSPGETALNGAWVEVEPSET